MDLQVLWIDSLKHLEQALQIRNLFAASHTDPSWFGMLMLYALSTAWIIRRWRNRQRPDHRGRLSRGVAVADGLLRFMSAVVVLGLSVMLALGRAAGRSHYRW